MYSISTHLELKIELLQKYRLVSWAGNLGWFSRSAPSLNEAPPTPHRWEVPPRLDPKVVKCQQAARRRNDRKQREEDERFVNRQKTQPAEGDVTPRSCFVSVDVERLDRRSFPFSTALETPRQNHLSLSHTHTHTHTHTYTHTHTSGGNTPLERNTKTTCNGFQPKRTSFAFFFF